MAADTAAEKAISSVRYSVSNTADEGQLVRRLRVVGRRGGQRCREPHRREERAGLAPPPLRQIRERSRSLSSWPGTPRSSASGSPTPPPSKAPAPLRAESAP